MGDSLKAAAEREEEAWYNRQLQIVSKIKPADLLAALLEIENATRRLQQSDPALTLSQHHWLSDIGKHVQGLLAEKR